MSKNIEKRFCGNGIQVVKRSAEEGGEEKRSRTLRGYAIRFNEESVNLYQWDNRFFEKIMPEAVTEEWLRTCDVKMTLFHDRERLLARYNKGKGSMKLGVDAEGVWFEFEAPETADGEAALAGVERGDLSGCSFTFIPKDYMWEERADGTIMLTHTEFEWLGEMTIESDPAYPTTSVENRNSIFSEYSDEKKLQSDVSTVAEQQKRCRETLESWG